jgi:hypothetical protein
MNAPLLQSQLEIWPLARLKPYARNAKAHDADQVLHSWSLPNAMGGAACR